VVDVCADFSGVLECAIEVKAINSCDVDLGAVDADDSCEGAVDDEAALFCGVGEGAVDVDALYGGDVLFDAVCAGGAVFLDSLDVAAGVGTISYDAEGEVAVDACLVYFCGEVDEAVSVAAADDGAIKFDAVVAGAAVFR